MCTRVFAWVVGWGVAWSTASANAQAPAAAFPSEITGTPAAPPATPATEAPPATISPPVTRDAPPSPPLSATRTPPAADPPPTPPAKAMPSWNVGAGIFSGGGLLNMSLEQSPLTYNAALERRLGKRTWLTLNGRASYMTREAPFYPTTAELDPPGTYRVSTSTAGALLGLRYVFAQGLVDVSGIAAAYANFQHVEGDRATGLGALGSGSKRELGLLLGMTVERELIEALALRLTLDIASASAAFDDFPRVDDNGVVQPRILGTQRLQLALQPGLQLHFYF